MKVSNMRKKLTKKFLEECFMYDPRFGTISWKARPREHFATRRDWMMFNSDHAGLHAALNAKESHLNIDGYHYGYDEVVAILEAQ